MIPVENEECLVEVLYTVLSAFLLFELSTVSSKDRPFEGLSFTPSGDNLAESVTPGLVPKMSIVVSPPGANPPRRTTVIWT